MLDDALKIHDSAENSWEMLIKKNVNFWFVRSPGVQVQNLAYQRIFGNALHLQDFTKLIGNFIQLSWIGSR